VHVEGANVVIPEQRGCLDDVPGQRMMVGRRRMPQSILNPLEAESVAEPAEVAPERRLVAGEDPLRQRSDSMTGPVFSSQGVS
jgi:hypothetical protein